MYFESAKRKCKGECTVPKMSSVRIAGYTAGTQLAELMLEKTRVHLGGLA